MLIYVLSLSDMRGQVDRQRIVAVSLDPQKLQDWMESFLVEPYDDEPAAASVRWGLAKGIIGCIDKWLEEYERRKKEGKE